jgi:hypothetical protein
LEKAFSFGLDAELRLSAINREREKSNKAKGLQ